MNTSGSQSSSFLCIGNGWFPTMPGGLNRYVYELIHQLANQQTWVELCGVGLPSESSHTHVKLTNLAEPGMPTWQRLWLTRKHFWQHSLAQLDAINFHFSLYTLPVVNALPPDIPVTFTFHGPWALESAKEGSSKLDILVKRWMEKRVYDHCDRFIVLSKAFGKVLHQNYQIPWDKIHIIPGGVDTKKFQANLTRQAAREQLNWPQDRAILFTPRRLAHRMGLNILLDAMSKIKSKVPEIWLAIAGRGPLKANLQAQINQLQLNQHVKLLGFLPDQQLPIAYQAADMTMIPSQTLEGFGLVVLESLACGTPVICTPVGGMPEILANFSPELVTDSVDVSAIIKKLELILTGALPLPSRTDCRNYTTTHFKWSTIAQGVRQVLLA